MYVSGFTIARNVVKADYPLKEAVYSILPLCDEMIISVGKSDDDTLEYVKSFDSPKIKIIESIWDESLRAGGKVLAVETNKVLDSINPEANWCFYIQADECLHEKYIDDIKIAMTKYLDNAEVEGLLFNYHHFYGSYNYLANSRHWYRKEIRIIKNIKAIRSYKDAQGFRINNRKLKVKPLRAWIYHYGWVKHPKMQLEKLKQARKLWHSDEYLEKTYADLSEFDFSGIDSIALFDGSHPNVMTSRIESKNWIFEHNPKVKRLGIKKKLLFYIESLTGWRIGENKNYEII